MISNYQSTDFPKAFPLFIPYLSNMSAPIEQVSQQVPLMEEVKVKKPKMPSLPAKHAKFMQFGAWFAQQLLESGDIDSELFDKIRAKLTVFDLFDAQMSFYSAFADQHKDFNKSLRKDILAHRRAIAKANKPPKSKKAPLSDKSQSDFIAHIISDAQSSLPLTSTPHSTPPPAQTTSPLPKQKPPKAPKVPKEKNPKENTPKDPKVPKENTPKAPKAPKEKTPKAPKEKTPKEPKATKKSTKTEQPVVPAAPTTADEDEELDVRPFIINGVNYLIDDQNNLYNAETHDEVGTFNPATNAVTLL
jgi:hypothetical protein